MADACERCNCSELKKPAEILAARLEELQQQRAESKRSGNAVAPFSHDGTAQKRAGAAGADGGVIGTLRVSITNPQVLRGAWEHALHCGCSNPCRALPAGVPDEHLSHAS